jgi:hypothetical protein
MNHHLIKSSWIVILSVSMLFACNSNTYRVDEVNIPSDQQQELKESIIRYLGKMPDKATPTTRFSSSFDEHYGKELKKYQLTHYYEAGNQKSYFVFIRRAPSIKEKFVATAGYVVKNNDSIVEYAESFRTWKMEMDELLPKVDMLFSSLIKGRDLSMYYPENSGEAEYIEFPNSETYYDKEQRIWISTRENVLEEYHQQLRDLE